MEELLPVASNSQKGLSSQVQALNSTLYSISTGYEQTILYKLCDYGYSIFHILYIYSAPESTSDTCRYIRVILSDTFIFANLLLGKGSANIRLFKDGTCIYAYVYGGGWARSYVEVLSPNSDFFYFADVTDEISISDLIEIPIS